MRPVGLVISAQFKRQSRPVRVHKARSPDCRDRPAVNGALGTRGVPVTCRRACRRAANRDWRMRRSARGKTEAAQTAGGVVMNEIARV